MKSILLFIIILLGTFTGSVEAEASKTQNVTPYTFTWQGQTFMQGDSDSTTKGAVTKLQEMLQKEGFLKKGIPLGKVVGKLTVNAWKKFQAKTSRERFTVRQPETIERYLKLVIPSEENLRKVALRALLAIESPQTGDASLVIKTYFLATFEPEVVKLIEATNTLDLANMTQKLIAEAQMATGQKRDILYTGADILNNLLRFKLSRDPLNGTNG